MEEGGRKRVSGHGTSGSRDSGYRDSGYRDRVSPGLGTPGIGTPGIGTEYRDSHFAVPIYLMTWMHASVSQMITWI